MGLAFFFNLPVTFEGVHGKRAYVTPDVMPNSPFVSRQKQGNLEGESSS